MVTNILSHVIEGHLKTSTENRNNDNLNLARNANTDGIIHKLVTVFAFTPGIFIV